MKNFVSIITMCLFFLHSPAIVHAQSPQKNTSANSSHNDDATVLSKALAYFSSKKYHEALILFRQLTSRYTLNARYIAFYATCCYYEWQFTAAAELYSSALPKLGGLAPHELSFYNWACAESYFNEKDYTAAIPYYIKMLGLCYSNERHDAHFKLGFCYYFLGINNIAEVHFKQAYDYYCTSDTSDTWKSRRAQLKNMINGLENSKANGHDS